jgi:hypothetical protein
VKTGPARIICLGPVQGSYQAIKQSAITVIFGRLGPAINLHKHVFGFEFPCKLEELSLATYAGHRRIQSIEQNNINTVPPHRSDRPSLTRPVLHTHTYTRHPQSNNAHHILQQRTDTAVLTTSKHTRTQSTTQAQH